MENGSDYNNACRVEMFLNRAFKYDERIPASHPQEFLNLIAAENGKRHAFLKPLEKQHEELRKRFLKAIKLLSKQRLSPANIEKINGLLILTLQANSSDDFLKIAIMGLEYSRSLIQ